MRFWLETDSGRAFDLLPVQQAIEPGIVSEGITVHFFLEGRGIRLFDVQLCVDDMLLDRVALSPERLRWRWTVGFHAGVVELSLSGVEARPVVLELTTDPVRAKMTRDDFTRMVGDSLLHDSLAIVALAGAGTRIARGSARLERGRFEYLRRVFDRIEGAVREIDRAPWTRVEREPRTVPLSRSGGMTGLELGKSLRASTSLRHIDPARVPDRMRPLMDALQGKCPERVTTHRALPNHRRREHSDILAVLQRWRAFLIRVRLGLDRVIGEADGNSALEIMQRQTQAMLARILALEKLPLFEGVAPSRGPVQPSHLFQRVRPYAAFFRAYQDFNAGLANVEGEFLEAATSTNV